MPCTVIVALLTVLRLPARTVRRHPLCRQIPLPDDRQESCQPEHGATTREHLRNMLSCLRQHGQFDSAVLLALLGGSSEQLERLRHAEDVADLLLQIAVEVSMDRDLRDEVGRCKVEHVHHDAGRIGKIR